MTTPPTTTPPSTAPAGSPPAGAAALLGPGDTGTAVLALQQQLATLGYWLGTPDGAFGDATEQAVYALQKAAGIAVDGVAGPQTAAALAAHALPRPRSASGAVIEIDLTHGLLLFVADGRLRDVLNTSTGGGYAYVQDGAPAVAVTPEGRFTVFRQVDGMVDGPLGPLWRPKYFDAGYAIHGSPSVPPVPVSHGCVRVSNEAIDWIWSAGMAPVGTAVWLYR